MQQESSIFAVQGTILHFIDDPFQREEDSCVEIFDPGLLLINNGYVEAVGPCQEMVRDLAPGVPIIDYRDKIILPGFVDTHLHYPQTDIIASFGKQLLEWLQTYTFPMEGRFSDPDKAAEVADFFFEELLRNGTTTAQVMPTTHPESVEAFFDKAYQRNLRMIAGKVMMDRNAPDSLVDTPQTGYEQSLKLIKNWHGKGRLSYAVTPRFAITSTEEQLERSSELMNAAPDLLFHTHLAENKTEVEEVARLFPWSRHYLDVYDRYGLVGENAIFAHSIYMPDDSYRILAEKKAAISFCPTSNLFIGSGLFDLEAAKKHGIKVGMGTDVGGGTSFSMLKTLGEAYKVLQLKGQSLSPLKAFYLATLGGAESLQLNERIGNFQTDKEADFVVLNQDATPLIERRMDATPDIRQKLFLLMILGDDRSVQATYSMGRKVYDLTWC
mgnify:CR=1 FL=1